VGVWRAGGPGCRRGPPPFAADNTPAYPEVAWGKPQQEVVVRTARLLATFAALAQVAAAQEPQSAGATDWFGRGIVQVRSEGTEVQLDLKTGSQGMLLRLVEGQPITIVAIGPFAAGLSTVRIAPEPTGSAPVTRERPTNRLAVAVVTTTRRDAAPPSADAAPPPPEFLLLVLSDQPIDSTVTRRIGGIPGFDPATAAHDLAEYLVGRRSPMWAGYLARR